MPDQIIGEVEIGKSTKLIFSISEWHGRQFAGVRKFVVTQRYEGWTKSGLCLPRNLLCAILDSLTALERSLPPKNEHEFKRVPKNNTEYIKITIIPADDKGLPLVDVREFVEAPSYQGPTKRGVRFKWNLLPDVLACLREQVKVLGENRHSEPSLFAGTSTIKESEEPKPAPPVTINENCIADLLGETIKAFPADFLESYSGESKSLSLPETPLKLEQDYLGRFHLYTSEGQFCPVRNPAEANFVIYAQMRGLSEVVIPAVMINVFKAVKAYEKYVRTLQSRLIAKILKKVGQHTVAEYEARKKMSESGLPWLSSE